MKKLIALLLTFVMVLSLMAACAKRDSETTEAAPVLSDEEMAANVAALIDAIYVQKRTDTTDADCIAAKEAWDALTDAQKAMVEGEKASPEYFGLDTGDASLDDPRNQDEIGENEILVVSFGTSFNGSRAADIKGIEDALATAFPAWSVRRAFTAQIIINHIQARDGECIDNINQALERAVNNGVKNLVVQPTHLMHGAEYDEMCEAINAYADKFASVAIAEPMLGEVGSDATIINADKQAAAEYIVAAAVESAQYESLDAAAEDGTAFVLMGHGTAHTAKVSYSQMATQMDVLGYKNVFIGTVEGEPEVTAVENVLNAVHEAGYTKVILRPLMVVAGDHANNDMAGDEEDSWKSMFLNSGLFESVEAQIEGMGSIDGIQQLYVAHTAAVINTALEDGEYLAEFNTDSGMFHANEAMDGKGTLTVKDGSMTLHVSLASKKIVNLYVGSAEAAANDEANWLQPTVDTVTYSDGTTDEVFGFDVPVSAIGADFNLAILGTKGTWYDHVVSVSNPIEK